MHVSQDATIILSQNIPIHARPNSIKRIYLCQFQTKAIKSFRKNIRKRNLK